MGFSQYVNAFYFNGTAEIVSVNVDKQFRSNFICEHDALKQTIERLHIERAGNPDIDTETIRLVMTGGRVENIYDRNDGATICNRSPGQILITGGTVYKAGTGGLAIKASDNDGTGSATIGPNAVIIGRTEGTINRL